MNEKTYYSLRFLESNAFHTRGDVLKATHQALHIGETADCEVRYELGQYVPELYASIVMNDDGKSWRLIQRSQHVKAGIAGLGGFGYVHELSDGDIISFGQQKMELEFHIHHDSNYGKTGIVIEQRTSRQLLYAIVASLVLAVCVFSGLLYHLNAGDIRYEDLERYLSSVYIVRVDSAQRIQVARGDTTLLSPTMVMADGAAVGTAFLTTDKKLVTARHCIEYWIGDDMDLMGKVSRLSDGDIRKWAILTETFMQERESDDTTQTIRVYFSICGTQMPDEPVFRFSSTDPCVHINRHHDEVLQFVDFQKDYYWRTIRRYYNNQEMELGDIVYIDVDQAGTIEMADPALTDQLEQSTKVALLGHPNMASGKKTTFAAGSITESRNNPAVKVSPDLVFDANITHGFSGGPLFVKVHGRIVAAGVVSQTDTDNGIYKKAVPITEIRNMENRRKEEKQ